MATASGRLQNPATITIVRAGIGLTCEISFNRRRRCVQPGVATRHPRIEYATNFRSMVCVCVCEAGREQAIRIGACACIHRITRHCTFTSSAVIDAYMLPHWPAHTVRGGSGQKNRTANILCAARLSVTIEIAQHSSHMRKPGAGVLKGSGHLCWIIRASSPGTVHSYCGCRKPVVLDYPFN